MIDNIVNFRGTVMKKLISFFLLFFLVVSSVFSFQGPTVLAEDDISGITLEEEMRAMIEKGIITGYGDGVYKPGELVTRGQFATFIYRALSLPEGQQAFTDVPLSSALAQGINGASAAGIVQGYENGLFGPNDPVTREQMAAIIDRSLVYLNVERIEAAINFTDGSQINKNFRQAVARNVHDGIIKGIPNNDGTFRFAPQKTATRAEAAAFISRMIDAAERYVDEGPGGEDPEPGSYKIATIDSNGELVPGKSYMTFEEANNAITSSNQVVTLNDQIVKMSTGLVISRPPVGSALTYIYNDSGFKNNTTYLPAQQEMKYIDSTDGYVKANLAGKTVYLKHTEVYLLPLQQVEGRNYYSVNSVGDLIHSIYSHVTNTYASYSMGKAPAFLTAGNKYYSWDGGVFYNTTGQAVGTAYQYFNYLPARTKTNYTAAELNRFIDNKLTELENLYKNNPVTFVRYKDAAQLSKLKGLGSYLKEAESKHKINALLILSMAMHESDYGMSNLSQERNNLFGLKAYDSNVNEAEVFPSPNEAIDALATRYLNKNYINPLGWFPNGGAVGNKARGFNVKYASDPFWGQKIAGHMYRADKFLGRKDFGAYRIAETTTSGLNVRSTPEVTSTNLQFTYAKPDMPVAVLSSSTWSKVLSDHNSYVEAYIHSNYLRDMKIAK
jgi:beta-N-acetylglucosaminidase